MKKSRLVPLNGMQTALVVCVAILQCMSLGVHAVFVRDYTVTVSDIDSGDWGTYQTGICTGRNALPQASSSDDGNFFDAVNITSPFFDDEAAPWYASPNGFLAATEYPMCPFFCSDTSMKTLYGTYAMTASRGSDWPILALFTADLDPTAGSGGDSVAQVCSQTQDAGAYTVVEYSQVPVHVPTRRDDVLTAQVVVYTNGTVIFRYKDLPASLVEMSPSRLPVAGISATASRFVPSPVAIRAGLALRFEPIIDTCAESPLADLQALCTSNSSCVWCGATSACMHDSVAAFRCPSGTFTATTGAAMASSRYSVAVDYDGDFAAVRNVYSTLPPNFGQSVSLEGFTFPFFPSGTSAASDVEQLWLYSPATFYMNDQLRTCNPLLATCVNGNFSNAILPYQSAASTSVRTAVSVVWARPPGSLLCPPTETVNCPPGLLIRVDSIVINSVSAMTTGMRYQVVNTQLFIDDAGTIDIVVKATSAGNMSRRLFTYPPAVVGVVRRGLSDPESLVIPAALIRSGLHVRYTLQQTACPDCGLHGRCDGATAQCVCDAAFEGVSCDACVDATRYGADCARSCPTCVSGYCDAGPAGIGVCVCPEGLRGVACADACPTGASTSGPECSETGGFVQCGACVCREGWHGDRCDTRDADPCRARSLGGCTHCAAGDGCSFCFDYTCFSPTLSGLPQGYACSYASPFPQEDLCAAPPMSSQHGPSYDVTLATLLAIILVLLAALLVVVIWLASTRRNVYDIHVVHASGGAPDLAQPRREREVRQVAFVTRTKQVRSHHLMAIPLKQISLKKLYERQHGLDNKSKKA